MAEEQEQQQSNQVAAAFPAPPFFWQHFTPENVERIEKIRAAQSAKQDATAETSSKLPPRILDLPKELRFLQPPDPPASGRYRSFGSAYTVCYFKPEGIVILEYFAQIY
jgi:mediator of RNA polymerase II transcription subunit 7